MLEAGERRPKAVTEGMKRHLAENGFGRIEYVELLAADDLSQKQRIQGKVILAVAVKLGETRLIDNMVLNVEDSGSVAETMLFS